MTEDILKLLKERQQYMDDLAAVKFLDSKTAWALTKDALSGEPDTRNLSVSCVITTQDEDRARDIVITAGIDTSLHQKNPTVLLNHGWNTSGMFPTVAKAQDPSGQYTVSREASKLRAVSWFSNSIKDSLHTFHLIKEGLLKGVSIGFNALEVKYREDHPEGYRGWPGLVIGKSELFEYSHCPVGCNPHALADAVGKGYLMGERISEKMHKALSPWLPDLKELVVGGFDASNQKTDIHTPKEEKTIVAETTQTPPASPPAAPPVPPVATLAPEAKEQTPTPAPTPAPVAKAETPPAPAPAPAPAPTPTVKEETPDLLAHLLPGARCLTGLHDRLIDDAEFILDSFRAQENTAIKAFLADVSERTESEIAKLLEVWKEEYPDDESPEGDEEEEEKAEDMEDEGEDEDEDDGEDDEDKECDDTPKSLTGSARKLATRLKALKAYRAKKFAAPALTAAGILQARKAASCLKELAGITGLSISQKEGALALAKSLEEIQQERSVPSEELKNLQDENARLRLSLEKTTATLEKLQREIRKRTRR